jgi:hypothetical protein
MGGRTARIATAADCVGRIDGRDFCSFRVGDLGTPCSQLDWATPSGCLACSRRQVFPHRPVCKSFGQAQDVPNRCTAD